jgi:excisionase family DNA binding protein
MALGRRRALSFRLIRVIPVTCWKLIRFFHRRKKMPSKSATPLARRLLTTTEAAEFLACGKNTLEQDRLRGSRIPYVQMGRSVRYDVLDLETFLAASKRRSTSELAA